jgi:hypothetical protein
VASKRNQVTWRKAFFLVCSIGALVAFFAFAGSAPAMTETASAAPSIVSDNTDYPPGATVTLTGSNWGAGESVHITVDDSVGQSWSYSTDVAADSLGNFTTQVQLPAYFVATYTVTATGTSSGTATTTFTDGNVEYSINRQPGTGLQNVNAGSSISFTVGGRKQGGGDSPVVDNVAGSNGIQVTGLGTSGAGCPTGGTQIPSAWLSITSPSLPQTLSSSSTFTNFTVNISPPAGTNGTYTGQVKFTVSAGGTGSGFNLCLNVIGDATAPTTTASASLSPGPGTYTFGDWSKQNVAVSLSATDNAGGSGVKEITYSASGAQTIASTTVTGNSASFSITGEGTTTINFFAKDNAGNTETTQTRTIKIDKTAPTITFTSRTAANADGWNNSDVTVNWSCSDGLSGVVSGTDSNTVTTEGTNQSATGTCTDNAGNSASNTQTGINIDKTDPVATLASRLPAANADGWNNSDVTVKWDCTDALSGAKVAQVSDTKSSDGANQTASATCEDKAGNTKVASLGGINIDTVAPTATLASRLPAANADGWNNSAVTVKWDCADALAGPKTAQVSDTKSSDGANQTASATCEDKAGNTKAVSLGGINIDTVDPTITFVSRLPAANADGWNNSDVTVKWDCADALSGAKVAQVSDTKSSEGTNQTADGTCEDKAGNTKSASVTGINIDKTDPTISATRTPGANADGWNNTDVTVQFSCDDPVHGGTASGVVSCPADVTLTGEGANQSVTRTVFDKAGNSASATKDNINIDKTAPTATVASRLPAANSYGWNNSDVTVKWNCADELSGPKTAQVSDTKSSEGADQTATATCEDKAGNTKGASLGGINIDKTAPNIGVTDNNAASYNVCGSRPSKPGFNPSDALSGLDGSQGETWTTPGTPSGVGNYTYSAHAQDKAGNSASYGPKTYTVLYGAAFGGYLQPINGDGSSRFKLGSTIPVKFQALCNGVPVGNVVAKMYVVKGDNQPDPGVDEAISTAAATTGNLFRYTGAPDNQYIFNLSTKLGYTNPDNSTISSFSQGSWTLKIGLDDGTFRSINIQLVK